MDEDKLVVHSHPHDIASKGSLTGTLRTIEFFFCVTTALTCNLNETWSSCSVVLIGFLESEGSG